MNGNVTKAGRRERKQGKVEVCAKIFGLGLELLFISYLMYIQLAAFEVFSRSKCRGLMHDEK